MRVVIDSNIFISNYFSRYVAMEVFCKHFPEKKIDVFISEVTYVETVKSFERDLIEAIKDFNKASRELNKYQLIKREGLEQKYLEERRTEYEDYFNGFLKKNRIKVIPIPKIPHQHILDWYYSQKRPFDHKDAGYKDLLIWLTVKNLLLKDKRPLIFITNDNDFLSKRDQKLHNDLIEDLSMSSIDTDQISICRSINNFNDLYLRDIYELVEAKELFGAKHQEDALFSLVENRAKTELLEYDLQKSDVRLSHHYSNPVINEIYDFYDFTIEEIVVVSKNNYSVKVSFELPCIIEFDTDASSLSAFSGIEYDVIDQSEDLYTYTVQAERQYYVEVIVEVKKDLAALYWFEVVEMSDID